MYYQKVSMDSSGPPADIYRRPSVFSDLLTVFRKNTAFSIPRRSIYHAPPPDATSSRDSYDLEGGGPLLRDSSHKDRKK